jgi:hypothetical protein
MNLVYLAIPVEHAWRAEGNWLPFAFFLFQVI